MNYKLILTIFLPLLLIGCDQTFSMKNENLDLLRDDKYRNSGFALIYNDKLENIKKIEDRSLNIYHKSLKRKSMVKITNPANGNFLIAEVKSNKVKFSNFYNSILSPRIAETLDLDQNEPYVEIVLISKNSTFIAGKSKTFEEESKAKILLDRIKKETSIKNLKIIELSKTNYRLLIGPFNDIKSLRNNFEKMDLFNFENLEVLKNV